jgi:glycosyltransferase involved in cell wall biosynthesis
MTLRVNIITYAWPPRNAIGAHRPYSWARYWSQAGAKVTVLTGRKYAYDAPLDLSLPELPGVEVIEVDYASASSVSRLASMVYDSPLRAPAQWLYKRMRGKAVAPVNPRDGWLAGALPVAEALAGEADAVVSTYDPRTVHQLAAVMKRRNPGLVWVADYRDLWSLNHAPRWRPDQQAAEAALEHETVGALADMVSSVSDELARAQGDLLGKPWLTVTNGFDVDISAIRAAIGQPLRAPGAPLRVVYTGKLYPGLRDPRVLLEELVAMEIEGIIARGAVVVDMYGGQLDGLDALLGSGRYGHIVRQHGHVPRDVALEAQRQADLLLLLESPLPEARGVLTGKIFEYMATGVPILSLGSRRDSAIGDMLASTRTGLCTQDERSLVRRAILDRMAGGRPDWFSPDLDVIAGFSREAQAAKLLVAIDAAVGSARVA